MRFTRYSSVQRRSRLRARCLDDTSSTQAIVHPQSAPAGMHQSTRRRETIGSSPRSWCTNVSAATATHVALLMPVDAPTATREKEPVTAIILIAAGATTAARTEARAPACRALRPSVGTTSTLLSHQGIDRLPISLSTPRRQTLDFGSKTIGLPAKPVVQIMTTSLSATFHCS